MAHIVLTPEEFELYFKALSLPTGTTLVLSDEENVYSRYRVDENGVFVLEVDFIENQKPWSSEQVEKDFLKDFTLEKLVDHFLVDPLGKQNLPYREYKSLRSLIMEKFQIVVPSGTYNSNLNMGNFQIELKPNSDLEIAYKELKFLINRVRENFPDLKELSVHILEKTLSEHGVYNLVIDLNIEIARIDLTKYGRTSSKSEKLSLLKSLEIIQERYHAPVY